MAYLDEVNYERIVIPNEMAILVKEELTEEIYKYINHNFNITEDLIKIVSEHIFNKLPPKLLQFFLPCVMEYKVNDPFIKDLILDALKRDSITLKFLSDRLK
jgi:hypothetical protein